MHQRQILHGVNLAYMSLHSKDLQTMPFSYLIGKLIFTPESLKMEWVSNQL